MSSSVDGTCGFSLHLSSGACGSYVQRGSLRRKSGNILREKENFLKKHKASEKAAAEDCCMTLFRDGELSQVVLEDMGRGYACFPKKKLNADEMSAGRFRGNEQRVSDSFLTKTR